jgi:hypothetical protein
MGLTTALSLEPGNVILVGGGHVDRSLLVLEVRGPSFESAFERIEAIRTLLGSIANTTVHGSYFVGVSVTDTIQDMGRDAKERQVLSTRFEVIR